MTVVARFTIESTRFIAPDGTPVAEPPAFAADRAVMVALYRAMLLTRTFDTKAIALQRTGRLGTYASSLGQEAVSVGLAHAMAPEDVLLPSFREHGSQLVRGVTLEEILLYWGGDERGNCFAGADFPVSVAVVSHAEHSAGVALAFQLRREPRAAVAVFGDGATSKGDVYEALNIAGAWTLPVVFVINNNQWAISVPRAAQTAAATLAQKAIAAGFEGRQVDGNDVIAVRHVVADALQKARKGAGPTLIEALTYRLGDHTTVDDASRYRDDEDVGHHWKEEPIARTRAYLTTAHRWTMQEEEALIESCAAEVERAAQAYLAIEPQSAATVFDYLYATLPPALAGQRERVLAAQGQ
jgi:pyruvate dehydrogenase E1 component alpha subunit